CCPGAACPRASTSASGAARTAPSPATPGSRLSEPSSSGTRASTSSRARPLSTPRRSRERCAAPGRPPRRARLDAPTRSLGGASRASRLPVPLEVRHDDDLRSELLDADVRRVEERHVVPPEEALGPAHLELAALEAGVVRAGAPLRAQLVQPSRVDREAEQLVAEGRQRRRQRVGLEVLLDEGEVRRPHPV